MDNKITNNNVTISGVITKEFEYSHEIFGEKFFTTILSVQRTSEAEDLVPITVSERLAAVNEEWTGACVKISGQFRSYNKFENGKYKLFLFVFAREFEALESGINANSIFLDGFICKTPIYRTTPFGREIADILVAVNRPYGKSDYIPCICWGRNARFISEAELGTHIKINGRIQSREYTKKFEDGTEEVRTAYEVSISRVDVIRESEGSDDN